MTARQRLESLTHSWYGYAVCAALFSIFRLRASGIIGFAIGFSIWAVLNAVCLVITLAIMAFLSRRLLARSSITRVFLVVVSGLISVLGALTVANEAWLFLHVWSFSLLVSIVATAVSVMMNARSFRVLTSRAVKAYCAG